jgi:hypothetical protein
LFADGTSMPTSNGGILLAITAFVGDGKDDY